jgi:carbonic anhydrase/acetyltransferase-like protein (isoleucine patch superfamily)
MGASIWFGAVLRGDNEWIEIGEKTNIQDNCTLHTDPGFPLTIGGGCTVGHNAILHGCSIGKNTLIGMGAILLNGAKIGDNCVVGAGALVGEGTVVSDRTVVVGVPAQKIRDIDEATINLNQQSAEIYFNRWQIYASTLKRLS